MARGRRRSRKPMRIDAAMRPMGFEDRTVKKCVDKLLKVYGEPDEGWYFIEEASYKLLIEILIEGDEESEPLLAITGGDGASSSRGGLSSLPLVEGNEESEPLLAIPGGDGASSSRGGLSSLPLVEGDEESEPLLAITGGDGASLSGGGPSSLPLVAVENYEVECVMNCEEDIENYEVECVMNCEEDIENYVEENVEIYMEEDAENYMDEDVDDKEAVVSLADIYDKCYALENGSQPQGNSAAQPEPLCVISPPRESCYGWISDGSGEDEFIDLPPEDEDPDDEEYEEYEDDED